MFRLTCYQRIGYDKHETISPFRHLAYDVFRNKHIPVPPTSSTTASSSGKLSSNLKPLSQKMTENGKIPHTTHDLGVGSRATVSPPAHFLPSSLEPKSSNHKKYLCSSYRMPTPLFVQSSPAFFLCPRYR